MIIMRWYNLRIVRATFLACSSLISEKTQQGVSITTHK